MPEQMAVSVMNEQCFKWYCRVRNVVENVIGETSRRYSAYVDLTVQ